MPKPLSPNCAAYQQANASFITGAPVIALDDLSQPKTPFVTLPWGPFLRFAPRIRFKRRRRWPCDGIFTAFARRRMRIAVGAANVEVIAARELRPFLLSGGSAHTTCGARLPEDPIGLWPGQARRTVPGVLPTAFPPARCQCVSE